MSYTNPDLVRAHLGTSYPGRDRILDRPTILLANEYATFHDAAVDERGLVVKANLAHKLSRVDLTLTGGRAQVGVSPLVTGSVVVASDSSLGRVFTENADYLIDYSAGEIVVTDDSAINDSQAISLWFEAFTVFTPGVDYVVDPQRAAIKRLSTGAIGNGQQVLIDFTPIERQISDVLIATAVTEANAMIESEIDPNGEFGADPTLQAAATCRALEALCRALAIQELQRHFADDKIATTWLKLAEQLSKRSTELIRAFRKPFSGPVAAAKT